MRRFINLYIGLFLLDAVLSLNDELGGYFSTSAPLFSGLRYFVAYLVIVLSLAIYAALGIDRRLPKRLLLPLILYAFWCLLALWPLSGLLAHASLGVAAAFGQVFIGGVVVITLRSSAGRNLLSDARFQQRPLFSWRNTLVFSVANLLLLPLALFFTLFALTGSYLEHATAGFMRLSPVGIYMTERTYQHDTKTVRLAATMHVGQEQYYAGLSDALSAAGTIILAEGVTDHDQLLKQHFSYGKLAGLVGLSSQEQMALDGNLVDLDDFAVEAPRDLAKPDIARGDLDLNHFNPETVELLNVLGATLLSDKPLAQGLQEYNAWAQQKVSPEWQAGVMGDILGKRNAALIDNLRRSLLHYDTVIIPWGALHMPALEAAVLAQGFRPGATTERLSIDFRALPYARLWQERSAPAD